MESLKELLSTYKTKSDGGKACNGCHFMGENRFCILLDGEKYSVKDINCYRIVYVKSISNLLKKL